MNSYDDFIKEHKSSSITFKIIIIFSCIAIWLTGFKIMGYAETATNGKIILSIVGLVLILIPLVNILYGIEFLYYMKLNIAYLSYTKYKKQNMTCDEYSEIRRILEKVRNLNIAVKITSMFIFQIYIVYLTGINIDSLLIKYSEFIPTLTVIYAAILYLYIRFEIRSILNINKLVNTWMYEVYVKDLVIAYGIDEDIMNRLSDKKFLLILSNIKQLSEK